MNDKLNEIVLDVINKKDVLVKIVASSPMSGEVKKKVLRRIESNRFLLESYTENKAFHSVIEISDLEKCLKTQVFGDFKQYDIMCTDGGRTVLTNKKGTVSVKDNKVKTLMHAVHNRQKAYIFQEGEDVPALKDLGVFTKENRIAASMGDKFRQINRFIETVNDVFEKQQIKEGSIFKVMDFGCGKSYLTFLLYHYLTVKRKLNVEIIGYDLKKDVVENCNTAAKKYGYDGLRFVCADIRDESALADEKIDMMVTLHACDVATDYALDYAIRHDVQYIFSVPCCQHEINGSIKGSGDYSIFFEQGLIKERFSALLTDAVRVKALENAGYSVNCLEFVGFESSPKNLMIRARLIKRESLEEENKSNEIIKQTLKKYAVSQCLLSLRERDFDDNRR